MELDIWDCAPSARNHRYTMTFPFAGSALEAHTLQPPVNQATIAAQMRWEAGSSLATKHAAYRTTGSRRHRLRKQWLFHFGFHFGWCTRNNERTEIQP